MSKHNCMKCKGNRLNPESLSVTINDLNIIELTKMTIFDINSFLLSITLTKQEEKKLHHKLSRKYNLE